MQDTIEIKIPAKPKYLRFIRSEVKFICEALNLSSADVNIVTLAVDEACSNIIKHAYEGSTKQPIHIQIRMYRNRLEFLIRDFGKKADLDKIKSRQLDDVRPGGLGVHLIRSAMDEVIYDNSFEIGNQLKLVKFFNRKKRNAKNTNQ